MTKVSRPLLLDLYCGAAAPQSATAAPGIDWMATKHELAEAVPPAYTEYIGAWLIRARAG